MLTTRQKVYDKYDGHCSYCGELLNGKFHVDHLYNQRNFDLNVSRGLVPKNITHVDHIDNLMPSCASCNRYKDTYTLEEFREELEKLVERLNLRSTIYRISKRFGQVEETQSPIVFYFEN